MTITRRICWFGLAVAGVVACDGGSDPGTDATPAPRCNPTAAFGRSTQLLSLNTEANEEQATLSADELTLYFSREVSLGNYDIYQATRTSTSGTFGNAVPVPGVNTAGQDRYPRVTADGLTMFASSKASSTSPFRVTSVTRASRDVDFGPLQVVPVINGSDTTNDGDAFISSDGRVLYFSSDRGGTYALYRSARTGAEFSAPELVRGTNLETVYQETNPVVSDDELTLYFGSSRPNLGMVDIYQATRASVQDGFGEPVPLTELNSVHPELPSWISPDGCQLYLTRYDPQQLLQLAVAIRGQ